MGIFGNVLKDLAKSTVRDVMVSAAKNEREESISLVRHAGGADEKNLHVKVDINCARTTLPLYVCRIIESAAHVSDVSYENMVNTASVYHEFAGEVSDQTFEVKEEGSSED